MTSEPAPAARTLLLLRHAKSSWSDPTLADHDRPLAPRGRRAAGRMAAHLESEQIRPDLVLCSSALRARDTLAALLAGLDDATEVSIEPGLYTSSAGDLLDRLRSVGPGVGSVVLIGHNPAIEELATDLAGGGDERALSQLHTKYPTGALAVLRLDGDWADLGVGRAQLLDLVLPRHLPR